MNTDERISMLQGLLARIQKNAALPRPARASVAPAAPAPAAAQPKPVSSLTTTLPGVAGARPATTPIPAPPATPAPARTITLRAEYARPVPRMSEASPNGPPSRPPPAPTTPPPAASAPGAPAPVPPSTQPAVDVNAVLAARAAKKKQNLNWQSSIVDLMKLLDLDSSLQNRQALAKELGYAGDTSDTATMNVWLQGQVMQKLAQSGGKVPGELLR